MPRRPGIIKIYGACIAVFLASAAFLCIARLGRADRDKEQEVTDLFTRGIKSERCVVNPGKSVEHKIENNERVRWLTPDEEIALIDTVRRMAPELELAVLVALYSGMRRSEQFRCNDVEGSGLKWSYVDLGKKLITIPRSKSGLSREIPIDDVLHDALIKLRTTVGSKYVFRIPPPDRRFPRIVRAVKVRNFKWHDLRHTFASRLVMAGVDIRTVQILMGHWSIITTMRYAHLSQKHLQEAVDKLHRPVAAAELTA
jgi:integrase